MKRSYSYSMTASQWASAALLHWSGVRMPTVHRVLAFIVNITCFGALAALVAQACAGRSVAVSTVRYEAGIALAALMASQFVLLSARRALLQRATSMTRRTTVHVDESGVTWETPESSVFRAWSAFTAVEVKGDYLFLHLDAIQFAVIPLPAFASREEAQAVLSLWQEHRETGYRREVATAELPPAPAAATPTATRQAPMRPVLRSIAADALRLTFLRALPEDRPLASWGLVLALALADVSIPIATAFASVGLHGAWYWYSLLGSLFHFPLLLGAAIVASLVMRRPEEVVRVLVAGLLVAIVLDLAWAVLSLLYDRLPETAYASGLQWLPSAWLALALGIFACRSIEPGLRRLAILASAMALVAYPLAMTDRDRTFWHTPMDFDAEGGRDPFGPATEAAFYKQAQLLGQELKSVRADPRGGSHVFFVGMAGYGGQDVFRKEVESVAELFRKHFGADGRTVRLINSNRTLLDVPIASATALRAALKRVGEVMDKDRDVLVLYMTSHGSKDHEFSLSLWPLSFERLDPGVVRAALDESGIRNRVVIVSACYSGGFVKPLEGPDTLVITASSADRNSFGCANDAEWTYFGKAYFDESLRTTHSFVEAFDMAAPRIAQREAERNFTPSQPQISVGSRIRVKLAQLSEQLDGRNMKVALNEPPVAPRDPAPSVYDQYVDLTYSGDYLRDLKDVCRASMQANGPEQALAKYPDAFGGMEKAPRYWHRLTGAWDAYGEQLCARTLDPKALRSTYSEHIHALFSEKELAPVIGFLRTREGMRWIAMEKEAARQQQTEIARKQAAISEELYAGYLKEMERIKQDYRTSRE